MNDIDLSLIGKNVKLIPYDEKYVDFIYENIVTDNTEGFEKCHITQKMDLLEFINKKYIKTYVKSINNEKIIGYIEGYNYNKTDGYIYVFAILNEQKVFNEEALKLFINFIFMCLPIRKIYCEVSENHVEKINILNEIGFNTEANMKDDTYFDGNYYNKLIMALNREDYKNE